MPANMLERIARSIYRERNWPKNALSIKQAATVVAKEHRYWKECLPEARAVLESMRDPTPAMLEVVVPNMELPGVPAASKATEMAVSAATHLWGGMVSAALADEPGA